nr:endospore germination permease [Paenibacillus sp. GSMTC-2017]
MSRGSSSITIWMSFSVLILSTGLVSHVMSIPVILGISGRDSWLSVIIATPIFLLWLVALFYILKQIKDQRLPDWIQRQFGIVPAWIFRISAIFILFISGTYTLQDTSMWTSATFIYETPYLVIIFTGAGVALLAAYGGIRSIALTSSVLLPLVIFLGYFVSISNMKYKDYSLMFPILEEGWLPTWGGVFYVIAGLLELWILLLFQHELKSKIKLWHLIVLGVFLISMTIGPTIGAITEFGPDEAAKQRDTAFEQWKILSLGDLLQHVDFMSIYQWLCGSFARVSISLYLITDMLDIRKPNRRLISLTVTTLLMGIIAYIPWRDDQTIMYLQRYHMPGLLIYVVAITVLLTIAIAVSRSKRRETTTNESRQT